MLTITFQKQVEEYIDEMLKEIKNIENNINSSDISALIIGGTGIQDTTKACEKYNIKVLNSFQFPSQENRDILLFPNSQELKLYFKNETYIWNIKNPNKLNKL